MVATSIPEGPHMHSTRMKTPGIVLAVLCAMFTLTLGTPRTVIAQSHGQTVGLAQDVFSSCAEQHGQALVLQPLGAYLDIAEQQVPVSHAALGLQSEERVHAELQAPA